MISRFALALILTAMPVALLPDQNISGVGQVTLGNTQGKAVIGKPGTLASTTTTVDQVIVTYTVTANKTFYLQYFDVTARLTTYAATATNFGDCSLESPAGTKLYTMMVTTTGQSLPVAAEFAEPIPIASATVVRIVCTPSAVTAFNFRGNLVGYER